jgi:hypothetical protein
MQRHDHAAQTSARETISVARPIIGPPTIRGTWVGALIGLALGILLGWALGTGRVGIPILNPMATPGAFDAAVALGGILGSAGGLIGALWGLRREPVPPRPVQGHSTTSLVQRLPVWGAWILAALWVVTLVHVATAGLPGGAADGNRERLVWDTKNSSRVMGPNATATAQAATAIGFSGGSPQRTLSVPDRWEHALAATPLVAHPFDGAIALTPGSSAATSGTTWSLSAAMPPAQAAASVDQERARLAGAVSNRVVVVGLGDPRYAMPAAMWAARTGDPILFVERNGVPTATAAALERRGGRAEVIVLAPHAVVSESVLEQLRQFGRVQRVAGDSPEAHAVRVAEAYDPVSGFGWGYGTKPGNEMVNRNYVVTNVDDWRSVIAAAPLARATAKSGPLLLVEANRVPPLTENFMWRMRPRFVESPAEGPFNHLWVVGGLNAVSFETQGNLDYTQEIEVQQLNGETAMGGYEAAVIAWIAMGLACGTFIAVHAGRFLPEVMPAMQASWAVMGLITGPVGLALYLAAYHRRPAMDHNGMTMWKRPFWVQVMSATVMTFAIDMLLMVLAVVLVAWATGFPTFEVPNAILWLGNSMMWMMILMFVIAFALMWTLFHAPMVMAEEGVGYVEALRRGLPAMGWSMVAESVGMMPAMWWLMMYALPGMEMPTDENVWLLGTLLWAVLVGLVTASIANVVLVRKGVKSGGM